MILFGEADVAQCSRAGCRDEAAWSVVWRNPKLHTPDRRKVWLACDAHVDYLRDFLTSRTFPVVAVAGVVDGSDIDLPEETA